MRATRILTQRPDRAVLALGELCQERDDELHRAPRSSSPAPRSMSAGRGGFTPTPAPNGWRSQSQMPYDRLAAPGAPVDAGNRSRQTDLDAGSDYNAQDVWHSSQGTNLGNLGTLGLQGFEPTGSSHHSNNNNRGRDTQSRTLETPGAGYRGPRRAVSAYDDGAGSGSISAPLSPHRLYAQLELGKGPQLAQSNWPTSIMDYDPRHHSTAGMPVASSSHRGGSGRSASLIPGSVNGKNSAVEPPSHLPTFAPFSPPAPTSSLRPLNGEPAQYISPSTLLSPPTGKQALPNAAAATAAIDHLVSSFDKMGVNPPGKGAENPAEKRRDEVESSTPKAAAGSATTSRSPEKKRSI